MSNPIGTLQELTVKMGIGIPTYTYDNITEPSSPSQFKCYGSCNGIVFTSIAGSKKVAKTNTATQILNYIRSRSFRFVESNPTPINDTKIAIGLLHNNTVDNDLANSIPINNTKNAISLLQEYTVQHGLAYPKYEFTDLTQPSSPSQFECYGICANNVTSRVITTSKASAKLKVAENMYRQLQSEHTSCSNSISNSNTSTTNEFQELPSPKIVTKSIDLNNITNAIGYLQEYTVKNNIPMPQYYFKQISVSSACIKFECIATCGSIKVSETSTNKKDAKLQAAQAVLSKLLNIPFPLGESCYCSNLSDIDGISNTEYSDSGSDLDNIFKSGVTIEKDAISKVNEYCAQNRMEYARYNPMGSKDGKFRIQCALENLVTEGLGTTKKVAKKNAAEKMLELIQDSDPHKMKISKESSSDDEIIAKFSELSFNIGTGNFLPPPEDRVYKKIDEYSTKSEIIEEPLEIKKEIVENATTSSPNTSVIDYVAEIKRMSKEINDLGVEYEITQVCNDPCVMYFSYIKSGKPSLSTLQTGSNSLILKYKLLDNELKNIKRDGKLDID